MDTGHHERRIQTICLLVLTVIAIGVALYFLRPVLIPFVLAVFLVYCLIPVIDLQMTHLHLTRPAAVLTTILLGCVLLFGLWLVIWTTANEMQESASIYQTRFQELLNSAATRIHLERFGVDPEELYSFLQVSRTSARGLVTALVSGIMSVLSNGLLVLIFMIFMLAGRRLATPPPPGGFREQVESGIRRYILTKVLVSAITGVLVGTVLALLGVDFAVVFGLLAFLLNFIPSIGSVIATLVPLPIVLLSPDLSWAAKIMAFVIPGAIQFSVGNVIEPKVLGRSLDLHPVVVLLGLIFFGMIWGIVGMFLATPIVAVLKIVLERIEMTVPVADLMAGRLKRPAPAGAGSDHG